MREEEPSLFDRALGHQVVAMLEEAVDCETQFAADVLAEGVAGLSLRDMRRYLEYVADQRLLQLGLEPRFGARNPFPFMSLQDVQELTQLLRAAGERVSGGRGGRGALRRAVLGRLAVAAAQHLDHGAQALRLAAARPSGPVLVVPGVEVEVREGRSGLRKRARKQRRHDASGHLAAASVGEIRDRAREVPKIRAPTAASASRDPRSFAPPLRSPRRARHRRCRKREAPARARDARGAGEGGEDQAEIVGALAGVADRIAEDQPALGVGVVDLDRQS